MLDILGSWPSQRDKEMHCPSCDAQNPEGSRFCLNCGAKLRLTCPQCKTELPLHARFCNSCGAELSVAAPDVAGEPISDRLEALRRLVPKEFAERLLATRGQVSKERRIVTILFSDVKGSTAMGENLDPEDVMEIMDGAFDVLIEPIYRYEGTLARLMGDAILAFFGAPIAHEDDPERACRAALEIIAGAQEYGKRLEQERGITGFNVRVGINTGLVVVGEVGSDLRVEYTAMGDAINLAARIESAAEPGTVLISGDTHKLIAPLFETEALGQVQVKGKTEPVAAYRLLAAKKEPARLRGIAGLESPLVGRQPEFAALREALERLRAGVGGIATVVGEAGLGKSRLVAEVRRVGAIHAVVSGANGELPLQWVEGRCLSYGTSIAYLLWLDVLRRWLGAAVDTSPVAVSERLRERVQALCPEGFEEVYPYLARVMSLPLEAEEESALRDLEGDELKSGTFQAMETFIQRAASDRPLVLVCEDFHWADPTSIELLEQLLALTDRASLLLICVFRPRAGHGSWRIRETAARLYRHRHTDLWLDPLSSSESEILASNLLQMPSLSKHFQERVLTHAEGNPLYVEEIIRSLIDSGAIVRHEASGSWRAAQDLDEMPIPDTLHGVLMARIDRLQEEAKRVLQMASVIGRIFLYRILEAIAQEEQKLDTHLLTLQREEMIRERARIPELEYIFKHQLTREAAYNGLLKAQRRTFHRQVAEVLERSFPDRIEEQLGLLAHHWERAGDADKATEYLLRAGDQARLAYAHQEAIDYYQRALAFLKQEGKHEQAARTLMKLGLTYHTAFDFRHAREAHEEGFSLWQQVSVTAPEPAAGLPRAPHPLRLPSPSPTTLDPTITDVLATHRIGRELFRRLVEFTPEMAIVPDLAQGWEVLEHGRKYVFHLRQDVCWSDGVPFTAQDFQFTCQRMLDPAIGAPIASLLYDIKGGRAFHQREQSDPERVGVRCADEHTLVIELEEPTGHFLHLLANLTPLPRHVVEVEGGRWSETGNIVVNGPFMLRSWRRGESLVLVRNPGYRGPFSGNIQRVELCFQLDWRTTLELYEADQLDAAEIASGALADPKLDRALRRHAGEHISAPALLTHFMSFNVRRPPFDDPRVRRALVMATDRETLVGAPMRGYAPPATGGFLPQGMPGHSAGIALPYDPEQARHLLAEAGYPGGRDFPPLEALATRSRAFECEHLRAQWREGLGIDVQWQIIPGPAYFEHLAGPLTGLPHLLMHGWSADYPDPDSFLRVALWKLRALWGHEGYERLLGEARRVMDQEERMKLYRRADQILIDEAAIMPMRYGRLHWLVKPWVHKFPVGLDITYSWKDVVIEPH